MTEQQAELFDLCLDFAKLAEECKTVQEFNGNETVETCQLKINMLMSSIDEEDFAGAYVMAKALIRYFDAMGATIALTNQINGSMN